MFRTEDFRSIQCVLSIAISHDNWYGNESISIDTDENGTENYNFRTNALCTVCNLTGYLESGTRAYIWLNMAWRGHMDCKRGRNGLFRGGGHVCMRAHRLYGGHGQNGWTWPSGLRCWALSWRSPSLSQFCSWVHFTCITSSHLVVMGSTPHININEACPRRRSWWFVVIESKVWWCCHQVLRTK